MNFIILTVSMCRFMLELIPYRHVTVPDTLGVDVIPLSSQSLHMYFELVVFVKFGDASFKSGESFD